MSPRSIVTPHFLKLEAVTICPMNTFFRISVIGVLLYVACSHNITSTSALGLHMERSRTLM
jgi:hypothetical protein